MLALSPGRSSHRPPLASRRRGPRSPGRSVRAQIQRVGEKAEAQADLPRRPGLLNPDGKPCLRLEVGAAPVRRRLAWIGGGAGGGLAQHRRQHVRGGRPGVGHVIEHDDDADPLGREVLAVAAPAAQPAAMPGGLPSERGRAAEPEAVAGRSPIGETHGSGEPTVKCVRIIAGCVDVPLPGDHVVEAGAHAGVAGPKDAVHGGSEAAGLRPFVAFGAVRHALGVGREEGGLHANAVEHPGPQQIGKARAGPVGHHVSQHAKVLVHVGKARTAGELQAAGVGEDARRLAFSERGLGRGAQQHGHSPVIPQPGLVVSEVRSAGRRPVETGERGANIVIQGRQIRIGVERDGAGELFGDGTHPEQGSRREGYAPLGVGEAPGVADENVAVANDCDSAPWSGVGARKRLQDGVEAAGEGVSHHATVARSNPPSKRGENVTHASFSLTPLATAGSLRPSKPNQTGRYRRGRRKHHQGRHVRRRRAGRLRVHADLGSLWRPQRRLRQDHQRHPRPFLGSARQEVHRLRRALGHDDPAAGPRRPEHRHPDGIRLQPPEGPRAPRAVHQQVAAAQLLLDPARRTGRPEPVGLALPRALRPGRAGIRRQPDPRGSPPRHGLRQVHQGALGPAGGVQRGAEGPAGRDHRRRRRSTRRSSACRCWSRASPWAPSPPSTRSSTTRSAAS